MNRCSKSLLFFGSILTVILLFVHLPEAGAQASHEHYLQQVKEELKKTWPGNRTINLVFHGHSVPAGYFKTPDVRTLEAYPHQVLKELKLIYPNAVINVIVTAIGGENSEQGQKRFDRDVLVHRPDVLFIDYALNDRRIGLARAKEFTESMIRKAQKEGIPVILLTPSPDLRVDLAKDSNELAQFSNQIRQIARDHATGLADSYGGFETLVRKGEDLDAYMSQSNHPNAAGHALIATEILKYFR